MSEISELIPVYLNVVPCHGCGACAEVAPELFEMDPATELPRILRDEGPEAMVRQAIAYCPNDCISTDEE